MCGLTGFARHPEGADLPKALTTLTRLLVGMEHRGRHATGIAALLSEQRPGAHVGKWATKASTVVQSQPYMDALRAVAPDTRVLMGHVRHATHNNAHKDEAAHPFAIGTVVGAHNGIIYNWREVEERLVEAKRLPEGHKGWEVDSQAALGALAGYKDPVKAMDQLDGYWALTWTKGRNLFLCRTNDAPTFCAYSKSMRTLFWHSERDVLARVLKAEGIADVDLWETNSGTLYRYDPRKFNEQGTNGEKFDAPFRGRVNRKGSFNSARPAAAGWGTKVTPAAPTKFNETWRHKTPSRTVSLLEVADDNNRLRAKVHELEQTVEAMMRMFEVSEEDLMLEFAAMQGEKDEAKRQALAASKDKRQLSLQLCVECGRGDGWGVLLPTNEGWVHEGCVMSEVRDGR